MLTQAASAAWPKRELHLSIFLKHSSINRILNDVAKLKSLPNDCKAYIRKAWRFTASRLESDGYRWICGRSNASVRLSTNIVRLHGQQLLHEVDKHLPEVEKSIHFGEKSIHFFHKDSSQASGDDMAFTFIFFTVNLKEQVMTQSSTKCCAFARSSQPSIRRTLEVLKILASSTVSIPDCTPLNRPVLWGRTGNVLIAFPVYSDSDATENMQRNIVYSFQNPRALKIKFVSALGLNYHANLKAWKNTELLFAWRKRLK